MARDNGKTTKALEILHEGVAKLAESDGWRETLRLRRALHSYSFSNLMLVVLQRPDATKVAGYRRWQDLGRQVRKGEKGIAILAPIKRTIKDEDEDGKEEKRTIIVGFKTVYVFDIAQTDGPEIPKPPRTKLLEGGDERTVAMLEEAIVGLGIDYACGEIDEPGTLGYYRPSDRSIRLRDGLSPMQATHTLAHELAHAVLHSTVSDVIAIDRDTAELEADSTAFLVLDAMGIDTGSFTFPYLLSYGGDDPEKLMAAGKRALDASDTILAKLDLDALDVEEAAAA